MLKVTITRGDELLNEVNWNEEYEEGNVLVVFPDGNAAVVLNWFNTPTEDVTDQVQGD